MSTDKKRKPRFQESVAYEYITKAQRIPRPYTSEDFKKETFIPDPYELCKYELCKQR